MFYSILSVSFGSSTALGCLSLINVFVMESGAVLLLMGDITFLRNHLFLPSKGPCFNLLV